jgi:glycerol-3-phosphate cytidylyltransferase
VKKVITFGVFDYFHVGHLRLFETAKQLGDYLIVAVQDEQFIKKYKPDANIMYSTQQRIDLVSALRIVDEVIIYCDVSEDIMKVDFDVFAIGEDQLHSGFCKAVDYCVEQGKEVVRMRRTRGICSSQIKNDIKR